MENLLKKWTAVFVIAGLFGMVFFTQISFVQAKKISTLNPITLKNIQTIATCNTVDRKVPSKTVQKQLGIGKLLTKGYKMTDVCRDDASGRIAFILAKPESNLLYKDTDTSLGFYDRVAFGTIDFSKKELVVILSQHRLGIYAEAYNQFCRIDTVQADGLFADSLYFYCGSGESGGFTNWYAFSFSDDNLTTVQQMTELGPPEVFDVKDASLIEKFRFKSNAEME